jgi:hypothetical protein
MRVTGVWVRVWTVFRQSLSVLSSSFISPILVRKQHSTALHNRIVSRSTAPQRSTSVHITGEHSTAWFSITHDSIVQQSEMRRDQHPDSNAHTHADLDAAVALQDTLLARIPGEGSSCTTESLRG